MQYRHRRVDDPKLIERLKALAAERLRWGWRRLIIMIRREGWTIGERAFRRIYRALGLHVMRTRKRHVRYVRGNSVEAVTLPNERWSLDFMHTRLMHGRTYRLLNVVDDFTGETLAIEPAFSFGGADVIRVLENIAYERGLPKTLRSDNELSAVVNYSGTKSHRCAPGIVRTLDQRRLQRRLRQQELLP